VRAAVVRHWFSDLYADIDAMRLDEFAAGLAPDVEVVVGNNPAMHGRQAAKEGIGYFFSTIDGIKHHLVNVAESDGLTFLEANVEYLRKDGKTVTIPAVTVLERDDDLVKSLRIYFDVAPVYA
jgi:SnoaL-like domain